MQTTKSLADAVEDALAGKRSVVTCPAHEDSSPSLSVGPGETQPVVLHCHAGCSPDQIIEAGGLNWAEVMVPDDPDALVAPMNLWTPRGTASNIYPYTDTHGTTLFEVLRVPLPNGKKTIMQRQPDETAKSGYTWNLDGVERVLYRLPQVLTAVKEGRVIHIAEGEKCVHALLPFLGDGEEATTNPMGAGKWEDHYGEMLSGATCIIYADADEAGRLHARMIRENLIDHGCTVSIKEAPPGILRSGKPINDVADHLEAGRRLEDLHETTPAEHEERARTGVDVLDLVLRPRGTIEYVIPYTLARAERLILVGLEGRGKSTLLRQMAVQAAAGIHPWSGMDMEPRKVLFIDAENHPMQVEDSWSELVGLAARADRSVERGMLTVMEEWESTIDLASAEGAAWLCERVHAYQPDLVVMGPLTNMSGRDLRDDEPVRKIRNTVNQARSICQSAFIMEHHAPHKGAMDKVREVRPYGSSLLLKWPDYGYGMQPLDAEGVYEMVKNRGPRVRSRRWPQWVKEGGEGQWPWLECVLDEKGNVVG